MREVILERLKSIQTSEEKLNILREYMQFLILKFVELKGYMKNIAFVGGTALRFLHDIGRFSEDLDYSLINKEGFSFSGFLEELEKMFLSWNLDVELRPSSKKTVGNTFVKFPGLMFESGITQRKGQKLHIKVEIDQNPPEGFKTELSFNQKYLPLNIVHYDDASLFAGKLHAILYRSFTKGRDIYDLMWFLGAGVQPNYRLLENAVFQTTGEKIVFDSKILKERLLKRVREINYKDVHRELAPFLENPDELKYLTQANITKLVEGI